MRILQGRGSWCPGYRIESLRRYAFIGDSTAYGFGVAPDQTLPAVAERQMNELLPAWPVEAVNFGVGGYNLWNSWLAFKYGPQVYDGVVLTLCSNDADLFERSYRVRYAAPQHNRWEGANPSGRAVERCFDDIASFSQEWALPVAVVYYNADDYRDGLRIGEIIGDLCAARGFPYIDTFAHYRDRHLKREDLLVSSADAHPSVAAHEAVGRHLAATLKRLGWLGESDASEISAAPDRILASAHAMVEKDHYPPEAALHWALGALAAKSRVARRLQALGVTDNFCSAAARTSEILSTATRRWHAIHRTQALVQDVMIGGFGMAQYLFRAQEEQLKFEELGFALGTGDWSQVAAPLVEVVPTEPLAETSFSDAKLLLEEWTRDSLRFSKAFAGLRTLAAPAAIGSPDDESLMLADLETLARLIEQSQAACAGLKSAFLRLESSLHKARPDLLEPQIAYISGLIDAAIRNVRQGLGFVPRLLAAIEQIPEADCSSFTTIEISISLKADVKRPPCLVSAQVNYGVPRRLPVRNSAFLPEGSPALVQLHFPVFYAGRFGVMIFDAKAANLQPVEATIVKVELYNGKNPRRTIDPAFFYKDSRGGFVSPLVHVP